MIDKFDMNKIINKELSKAYIKGKQDAFNEIMDIVHNNILKNGNGFDSIPLINQIIELIK